jgi:hypothetical protein
MLSNPLIHTLNQLIVNTPNSSNNYHHDSHILEYIYILDQQLNIKNLLYILVAR